MQIVGWSVVCVIAAVYAVVIIKKQRQMRALYTKRKAVKL
jgi:hypothetical protein